MVKASAHTEWTICFIKILQCIMSMICMIFHIKSTWEKESMPHIVLFCATFGGFFILSFAGIFVPISGQLSPPGVDMIFSLSGFILFYMAATAAMFFAENDPHLSVPEITDLEEYNHPFFQHCVQHAILSLATGTLFLLHAVISGDRLAHVKKGNLKEDEAKDRDPDEVDIDPDDKITLHLFLLDWLIHLWNTKCCKTLTNAFKRVSAVICKPFKKFRDKHKSKRFRRKKRKAKTVSIDETPVHIKEMQKFHQIISDKQQPSTSKFGRYISIAMPKNRCSPSLWPKFRIPSRFCFNQTPAGTSITTILHPSRIIAPLRRLSLKRKAPESPGSSETDAKIMRRL